MIENQLTPQDSRLIESWLNSPSQESVELFRIFLNQWNQKPHAVPLGAMILNCIGHAGSAEPQPVVIASSRYSPAILEILLDDSLDQHYDLDQVKCVKANVLHWLMWSQQSNKIVQRYERVLTRLLCSGFSVTALDTSVSPAKTAAQLAIAGGSWTGLKLCLRHYTPAELDQERPVLEQCLSVWDRLIQNKFKKVLIEAESHLLHQEKVLSGALNTRRSRL